MSTSDKQCRIIALFNQAGGVAKSTQTHTFECSTSALVRLLNTR
ncbi:hypothetical protein [Nostoc sp. FACHB-190]|nr:hypothetical protein [Nostoc sp. FACHB-190]